jgi:hypothetical protein
MQDDEVECAAETTHKETERETERGFSYVIQVKHTGNVSHRAERDGGLLGPITNMLLNYCTTTSVKTKWKFSQAQFKGDITLNCTSTLSYSGLTYLRS